MDFGQLRTLVHVAELGSLSKAADRLRIAQPALSRQIRLLAQATGADLDTCQTALARAGGKSKVALVALLSSTELFWLSGWLTAALLAIVWLTKRPAASDHVVAAD